MVNKRQIWASVVYLRKFKDLSKAVQLVSIAKLRKLTKNLTSRDYALSIAVEMFDDLSTLSFLYRQCTFVVITSERSCCGRLNNNVVSSVNGAIAQ